MNHDTSHHPLPSLVAHVINDGTHYIDNLFASAWNSLNLNRRLEAAGFAKRSGIEVTETVFVLMVWRWLNVSSIAVFCRTALSVFSRAKKDVLYDFLKREDIHWRKLNLHTAKEVYRQHALHHSQVRAYVLDDSIKARRGASTVPKMRVDGRCEDVIFFDGVFFGPSLTSIFFAP